MIELKDLTYVRLGTRDLAVAEKFAVDVIGLQVGERRKNGLYLRSDSRAHSLCYFEGDPADQVVGFEVADSDALTAAGDALARDGHPVRRGSAEEAEMRGVHEFIAFHCPSGNHIELVTRPQKSGAATSPAATRALPDSTMWAFIRRTRCATKSSGPRSAMRGSAIASPPSADADQSDPSHIGAGEGGDTPASSTSTIRSRRSTTSCGLPTCWRS